MRAGRRSFRTVAINIEIGGEGGDAEEGKARMTSFRRRDADTTLHGLRPKVVQDFFHRPSPTVFIYLR